MEEHKSLSEANCDILQELRREFGDKVRFHEQRRSDNGERRNPNDLRDRNVPRRSKLPKRYKPEVVEVEFSNRFENLRFLGENGRFRRWFPIEYGKARIYQEIARRLKVKGPRRDGIDHFSKDLLSGLGAEWRKWADDWKEVWLNEQRYGAWHGVLKFTAFDPSKKGRTRKWTQARLDRLYASGLTAYTVRVDLDKGALRVEYSGRKARSQWVPYSMMQGEIMKIEATGNKMRWREAELSAAYAPEQKIALSETNDDFINRDSDILRQKRHVIGGDVL